LLDGMICDRSRYSPRGAKRARVARGPSAPEATAFTPAIIDPPVVGRSTSTPKESPPAAPRADVAPIALEIGGATVRLRRDAHACCRHSRDRHGTLTSDRLAKERWVGALITKDVLRWEVAIKASA
jgi:hypothetical protein